MLAADVTDIEAEERTFDADISDDDGDDEGRCVNSCVAETWKCWGIWLRSGKVGGKGQR